MKIDLKQFFTREKVASTIKRNPPKPQTVSDVFFPRDQRGTWDSPIVPLGEIITEVGVAPVVHRNGEPVVVSGDEENVNFIVPLPIYLETDITAVDLQNLKVWKPEQRQAWADRKIQNLRDRTNATTEVLCAQTVFGGKIDHALQVAGGGFERYTVSFGSNPIQSVAVAANAKWNHDDATMLTVYTLFSAMTKQLRRTGFSGKAELFSGTDAFAALLALVNKVLVNPSAISVPVTVGNEEINVGGYVVKQMDESYTDPGTGAVVDKIPPKEIRMVAKGYTSFHYTGLDDLAADLNAMPLFIDVVEEKRPSRLIITSMTKPLPAANPQATVKALVVT